MRELNNFQEKGLDMAGALTKAQLQLAVEITNDVLANDQRLLAPEVLGAVVQALATNYAQISKGSAP